MNKSEQQSKPKVDQEPLASAHHHHLLCWKSTFAGVLVSLMGFLILAALGSAVVGYTAESLVDNRSGGSALATGAGLWTGISIVIALFCGSYFALRISRFMTNKVGAAHGIVIASISFLILLMSAGSIIGGAMQSIGRLASGASQGAAGISSSPAVQDTINRTLGSQLKSSPQEVAQGLAVRLIQGDTESAKSYYAYQTGLPAAEVDAKITQLKSEFDNAVTVAGQKAANAVGDAGLTLFVLFIVGLVSSVIGGRIGAQANITRPFAKPETDFAATNNIGFTPARI